MGVVTVIGEDGVQVLVEFVGGPRDGKRSFVVASTDLEGKPMPPSGFASEQVTDRAAADSGDAGRYARDGITQDGEAVVYAWRSEAAGAREPEHTPLVDLAARIRRDYARRANSDPEQADPPKRRPSPLRERIDRLGR
jgi:hypothetical protein